MEPFPTLSMMEEAAASVRQHDTQPRVGMILGSGLSLWRMPSKRRCPSTLGRFHTFQCRPC